MKEPIVTYIIPEGDHFIRTTVCLNIYTHLDVEPIRTNKYTLPLHRECNTPTFFRPIPIHT